MTTFKVPFGRPPPERHRLLPPVRRSLICTAILAALGTLPSGFAWANPTGGVVVGGQAQITHVPGTTTIEQGSKRAIINWQGFSIGRSELTRFNQPGHDAIALNRVVSKDPSSILGQLKANGHVWLVNPNGILFGPDAQVDVHGLIATTADIADDDFMAGSYDFSIPSTDPNASVVNMGSISIGEHGLAGLVAPHVRNEGVITGRLGQVVIAGAPTFTLDFYGDGLIQFAATSKVTQSLDPAQALVRNDGTISVDGGNVLITADAAADVVGEVINMEGVVEAHSFAMNDGTLVLDGGDQGIVRVAGVLDASGTEAGAKGGTVKVLGDKVGLFDGTSIDVSGHAGGGDVLVGGNYQGKGPEPNAKHTYVSSGVSIHADARTDGDGGRVIVWADEVADIHGDLTARGGTSFGDGGLIETSAKQALILTTTPDASAPNGKGGKWLIDPRDITIVPGDQGGLNANIVGSVLINNALSAGTDVEITTFTGFPSNEVGNILQQAGASIAKTAGGNATLVLSAENDIVLNDSITSSFGQLEVVLEGDSDRSRRGAVFVGGLISTNGGDIQIAGINNDADVNGGFGIVIADALDSAGGSIAFSTTDAFGLPIGSGTDRGIDIRGPLISNGGGIVVTSAPRGLGISDSGGIFISGAISSSGGVVNLRVTRPIDVSAVVEVNAPVSTAGGDFIVDSAGNVDINATITTNGGSILNNRSINFDSVGVDLNADGGSNPGGSVTVRADGNISTGNIFTRSQTSSSGDIFLTTTGGAINASGGDLNSVAVLDNAGAIGLEASGDITTGDIFASALNSAGIGDGNTGSSGQITLVSDNGNIQTGGLLSPTEAASGSAGPSGGISVTANNGSITVDGLVWAFSNAFGSDAPSSDGGPVTFSARDDITVRLPSGAQTTRNIQSKSLSDTGIAGNGNSISLTSLQGSIDVEGEIVSFSESAAASGVGGDIDLRAAGSVNLGNVDASSSGDDGGDIAIIAGTGVVDTANLDASATLGAGGGVTISAAGNVNMGSISTVGDSAGGNVQITSTAGHVIADFGAIGSSRLPILASASAGDGGTVSISGSTAIEFSEISTDAGQGGVSGPISLTADEIDYEILRGAGAGLLLQPATADRNIRLGGAVDADDALTLTTAQLNGLGGFASITIGRTDIGAGTITIDPMGVNLNDPISLQAPASGGALDVNGPLTTADNSLAANIGGSANINGRIDASDVDITAGDVFTISNLGSINTGDGFVRLQTSGPFLNNGNISASAGGDVDIISQDGLENAGTVGCGTLGTACAVSLSAGGSIFGSGVMSMNGGTLSLSAGTGIAVTTQDLLTVAARTLDGDISISNTGAGFEVGTVDALSGITNIGSTSIDPRISLTHTEGDIAVSQPVVSQGDLTITASGDIRLVEQDGTISATDTIDIRANGSIENPGGTKLTAPNLIVSAPSGRIGITNNPLFTSNGTDVSGQALDAIFIENVDGGTLRVVQGAQFNGLQTTTNPIALANSVGDLIIDAPLSTGSQIQLVGGPSGNVIVNAPITANFAVDFIAGNDVRFVSAVEVIGARVDVFADNAGDGIGAITNPGGAVIRSADSTFAAASGIGAGAPIILDGDVTVRATNRNSGGISIFQQADDGTLLVAEAVSAGGDIVLESLAELIVTGQITGDDLILRADSNIALDAVDLTGTQGNIIVQAESDILIDTPLALSNQTAGERVVIQAGEDIALTNTLTIGGAALWLEADSPHVGGSLSADGNGAVTTTTNAPISTAGGNVNLIADLFNSEILAIADAGSGDINLAPSLSEAVTLGDNASFANIRSSGVLTLGRAQTAGPDGLATAAPDAQTLTAETVTLSSLTIGDAAARELNIIANDGVNFEGVVTIEPPLVVIDADADGDGTGPIETVAAPGNFIVFNDNPVIQPTLLMDAGSGISVSVEYLARVSAVTDTGDVSMINRFTDLTIIAGATSIYGLRSGDDFVSIVNAFNGDITIDAPVEAATVVVLSAQDSADLVLNAPVTAVQGRATDDTGMVLRAFDDVVLNDGADLTTNKRVHIIADFDFGGPGDGIGAIAVNGAVNIDAGSLELEAAQGIASEANPITVDGGTDIGLASSDSGDIFILNTGSGDLTITGDVSANDGSVSIRNPEGALTLGTGATITAAGAAGNSIVLQADTQFANNATAGVGALQAPNGRFLIYAVRPSDDQPGGLETVSSRIKGTFADNPPDTITPLGENFFVYQFTEQLIFSALSQTAEYGDNPFAVLEVGTDFDVSFSDGPLPPQAFDGEPSLIARDTQGSAINFDAGDAGVTGSPYDIDIENGGISSSFDLQFIDCADCLDINPAPLIARVENAPREYGEANPLFDATFTGFKLSQTEVVLEAQTFQTDAVPASDVGSGPNPNGTFPIRLLGFDNPNYTVDPAVNDNARNIPGELTITPAPLQAQVQNAPREYGEANPLFDATFNDDGFRLGQTEAVLGEQTFQTDAVPASDVGSGPNPNGTFPIRLLGFDNPNYTVDPAVNDNARNIPGELTITAAALQAQVQNASREYGEANPLFDANFTGFKLGQTEVVLGEQTFQTDAVPTSDVGSGPNPNGIFPIRLLGFDNPNYTVDPAVNDNVGNIPGELTITPAPLTITANDASRGFAEQDPAFTASFDGFRVDDDASVVSGLTFQTAAELLSPPGLYDIGPFGATADNYSIEFIDGILTVIALRVGGLEGGSVAEIQPDVRVDEKFEPTVPLVIIQAPATTFSVPKIRPARRPSRLLFSNDGNHELWGR